MYSRDITAEILSLSSQYPVIGLIGPRQSGKTTLVQAIFQTKPYLSLEDPDIREQAKTDPRGLLSKYPSGAILDEVQRVPELLSYIQTIVDRSQLKGMFILTGSHQLQLHDAISQSLAGRIALLTLLPLSLRELKQTKTPFTINELLYMGGYPRIHKDLLNPTKSYKNYFLTYVEKDVRQLIHLKNLVQFERFIKICAGRIGSVINLEQIGGEIGLSSNTVKEWLSILEASFIIFRLHPYFENFGKRIIKSPKLYFTDVGLASYLLGIEDPLQLERDPLRGHLVENLVILELLKTRLNQGLDPNLYYFRDASQHEVDVIFKKGSQLIPIEIKSSQTFHSDFVKSIKNFKKIALGKSEDGYLIFGGEGGYTFDEINLLNLLDAAQAIDRNHPTTKP